MERGAADCVLSISLVTFFLVHLEAESGEDVVVCVGVSREKPPEMHYREHHEEPPSYGMAIILSQTAEISWDPCW